MNDTRMKFEQPGSGKNSNDKHYKHSQANQPRTGKRVGGRNGMKRPTVTNKAPRNGLPIVAFPVGSDGNPATSTTDRRSDFSYEITGQPAPTDFSGVRDNTLFKDWNRQQVIPKLGTTENTNACNSYTKILTCDFKDNIKDPSYATEWELVYSNIIRDVIQNTNASKGAFDVLNYTNLTNYIHEVARLYTYLYELEVIMGWSPSNHEDTNAPQRHLAEQVANETFLNQRTQMREVLRSAVLPLPMMKYLRWLREYKRSNAMPESPKLAFRTQVGIDLINKAYDGDATQADYWNQNIASSIAAVRLLDARIPALLSLKVDCVNFVPVKDYYGSACNMAVYDPEFNNIFNNRLWVRGPVGSTAIFPKVTTTSIAAFNTETPLALSLANLSTQISKDFADLPLENRDGPKTFKLPSSTVDFSHFYAASNAGNVQPYLLNPVKHWFESGNDSTYIVDDATTVKGIAIPKGDTLQMFYPGVSNINMAKRMSFSQLF
jgi:hypothetical protein